MPTPSAAASASPSFTRALHGLRYRDSLPQPDFPFVGMRQPFDIIYNPADARVVTAAFEDRLHYLKMITPWQALDAEPRLGEHDNLLDSCSEVDINLIADALLCFDEGLGGEATSVSVSSQSC